MKRSAIGSLFAGVLLIPALGAQDMIGVSWSGDVYTIDSATGMGGLVGWSGLSQVNAMARRASDGKVFVGGGLRGSKTKLYEIDPATGAATFVVTVQLGSIRGLAFGAGDVLYAINDPSAPSIGEDVLHTIDLVTGAAPMIGATGYFGVQGLAYGNGKLYAWDCGSGSGFGAGLIEINTSTGAGTDVSGLNGGTCSDVQALTFSPGGVLHGIHDALYTIDTVTGGLSLVGFGGYSDICGCDFVSAGGGLQLTLGGSCPGPMTAAVSGATPFGSVAILRATGTGSVTIPPGNPCAGTVLGLNNTVTLAGTTAANGTGNATFGPVNVPAGACGNFYAQALDISSCATSNVVLVQ